ncbi:DUF305 domain-containing protein [Brevundimonas variabilis]|uniref:Uncharacterized protein (DUF305 family) n=1 Tax=Brevundimonas variabilis TaxID=74312 RepID=A0A7W9FEY8_9CAUL|nr:DUF305 domain-containing protein [Brevundimonas variabilis]MBB5746921.1 uncharacterized protein (DUF305 family) [Brevundimonas variabilis]
MRALLIIASALALTACGQGTTDKAGDKAADHAAAGHDGATAGAGDAAFAASEAAMHTEMAAATGDTVDESYVAKMIAHHRGAVAMADVALAQSQDPGILRMAQMVKDTQTAEIAEMQAWQPAPPVATPPAAPAATTTPASPEAAAN